MNNLSIVCTTHIVGLGIAQLRCGHRALSFNLTGCAMTDEQWLAAPLERHGLALWDVGQLDFDLGHGQHIGCGAHRADEGCDQTFGGIGTTNGAGTDHQVREGLALLCGVVATTTVLHLVTAVGREVRHLQIGVTLASG